MSQTFVVHASVQNYKNELTRFSKDKNTNNNSSVPK